MAGWLARRYTYIFTYSNRHVWGMADRREVYWSMWIRIFTLLQFLSPP